MDFGLVQIGHVSVFSKFPHNSSRWVCHTHGFESVVNYDITTIFEAFLTVPSDYYQTSKNNRKIRSEWYPVVQCGKSGPDLNVIVVVDGLRVDYVDDELTPYLSNFIRTNAITPGSGTFSAVSSLISGKYPNEHGAMRQTDGYDESMGIKLPARMDKDQVTLTETIGRGGLRYFRWIRTRHTVCGTLWSFSDSRGFTRFPRTPTICFLNISSG